MYTDDMSPFILIIVVLVLAAVIYAVRYIAKARGMSRATKILLPTSVVLSVIAVYYYCISGYDEIAGAFAGVAGTMTLVEGHLRHKAERSELPKEPQGSDSPEVP